MTTFQFVLLIICFLIPTLFQRTKFAVNRQSFHCTPFRELTGLNIHHGHWGVMWAFVAAMLLAFNVHNTFTICLLGFGFGLMLDEIIPLLLMPSPGREAELDVYERSKKPTQKLFVTIVVCLSIFFFIGLLV